MPHDRLLPTKETLNDQPMEPPLLENPPQEFIALMKSGVSGK
jgi:hypothetical protein